MVYRVDERLRCEQCEAVLGEREAAYGSDGRRLCRACHSAALIQRTDVAVAAERLRGLTFRHGERSGPERPAWWGYALMSPALLSGAGSMGLWIEHEVTRGSCSELGCLGIALAAFAGIIVGIPSVLVGVVVLPARLRGSGLLVGTAALVASVLPVFVIG